MGLDPYQNLAEILEGALSLVDYYVHRMSQVPATVGPAKAAVAQLIADLQAQSSQQQAAD